MEYSSSPTPPPPPPSPRQLAKGWINLLTRVSSRGLGEWNEPSPWARRAGGPAREAPAEKARVSRLVQPEKRVGPTVILRGGRITQ